MRATRKARRKTGANSVKQAAELIVKPTVPSWVVQAADFLNDAEASKREAAARRLRDASTAICDFAPFFAGTLTVVLRKDEVPRVRFVAAQAIGALGSQAGQPYGEALAVALKQDPSSQVREAAAKGLGMIGGHLDELRTVALDDGFADVRRQAAQALGCSGRAASEQLEALVDTLAKHDFHVMRCRAATAIGDAGADASGPYAEALAAATLTDPAAGVRMEAARALAKLGDAAAAPGVTQLTAALQDGDAQRRKLAARAFAAIGEVLQEIESTKQEQQVADLAATRRPLEKTTEELPPRRRRRKTEATTGKKVATSRDASPMSETLVDQSGHRASPNASPKASPKRKGRRRIPEPIEMPESPSGGDTVAVLPATVVGLTSTTAEGLAEAALGAALNDSDALVRFTAGEALRAFGPSATGPDKLDTALSAMVKTALHHDNAESRCRASEALGSMGDLRKTHAEVLAASLDDRDPIKQRRAAEALRDLGTPAQAYREKLTATLLDGPAEDVRKAAARALSTLDTRPLGAFGRRTVRHSSPHELSRSLRFVAEAAPLQLAARCTTPHSLRPEFSLTKRAQLPPEFSLTSVYDFSEAKLEEEDDEPVVVTRTPAQKENKNSASPTRMRRTGKIPRAKR